MMFFVQEPKFTVSHFTIGLFIGWEILKTEPRFQLSELELRYTVGRGSL